MQKLTFAILLKTQISTFEEEKKFKNHKFTETSSPLPPRFSLHFSFQSFCRTFGGEQNSVEDLLWCFPYSVNLWRLISGKLWIPFICQMHSSHWLTKLRLEQPEQDYTTSRNTHKWFNVDRSSQCKACFVLMKMRFLVPKNTIY